MFKKWLVLALGMSLVGCGMDDGRYLAGDSHYSKAQSAESYFPETRAASGRKEFVFSPRHLSYAAYNEEGQRVKVGPAGGGVDTCPEEGGSCRTVVGTFKISQKGDASCRSKKYPIGKGGAPMAYCMHFFQGYTIHGAPGYPVQHSSHGCIHLAYDDAKWLNEDFLEIGSTVEVQEY